LHTFVNNFQASNSNIARSLFAYDSLIYAMLNTTAKDARLVLQPFWDSLKSYDLDPLQNSAEKAAEGSLALSIELTNNLDDPIRLHMVQQVSGEKQGQAFLEDWRSTVKNLADTNGLSEKVQLKLKEDVYKDRNIHSVTFNFEPDDPEAKTPESLWGEQLTLYQTVIDQTLISSNGEIKNIYSRLKRNQNHDSNDKWPGEQVKNVLFAGRLNLIEALRSVQMYLAKSSTGFNPLLIVKIPEIETRGVTARVECKEEMLVGTIDIPAKEIHTLIQVITNRYPIDTKARNSKGRNQ